MGFSLKSMVRRARESSASQESQEGRSSEEDSGSGSLRSRGGLLGGTFRHIGRGSGSAPSRSSELPKDDADIAAYREKMANIPRLPIRHHSSVLNRRPTTNNKPKTNGFDQKLDFEGYRDYLKARGTSEKDASAAIGSLKVNGFDPNAKRRGLTAKANGTTGYAKFLEQKNKDWEADSLKRQKPADASGLVEPMEAAGTDRLGGAGDEAGHQLVEEDEGGLIPGNRKLNRRSRLGGD